MKVSGELYNEIVGEIGRLSKLIFLEELNEVDIKGAAMLINHLAAILIGRMDISDFHDEISHTSENIREYYYKLLYLIK